MRALQLSHQPSDVSHCIKRYKRLTIVVLKYSPLGPIHSIDQFNESFSTVKDGSVFTCVSVLKLNRVNSKTWTNFDEIFSMDRFWNKEVRVNISQITGILLLIRVQVVTWSTTPNLWRGRRAAGIRVQKFCDPTIRMLIRRRMLTRDLFAVANLLTYASLYLQKLLTNFHQMWQAVLAMDA